MFRGEGATVTTEALGDQIAALAADIEAAMCRWLELVAEFDRREGWFLEGCTSCAAWVSWRCGVGPTAARETRTRRAATA